MYPQFKYLAVISFLLFPSALILAQSANTTQASNGIARISLYFSYAQPGDTVLLELTNNAFDNEFNAELEKLKATKGKDGKFSFSINNIDSIRYFDLTLKHAGTVEDHQLDILKNYLIEPNDDVAINVSPLSSAEKNYNIHESAFFMTGRGATKYFYRHVLDSLSYYIRTGNPLLANGHYNTQNLSNQLIEKGLKLIVEKKGSMTSRAYNLLIYDWIGRQKSLEWYMIRGDLKRSSQEQRNNFISDFHEYEILFSDYIPTATKFSTIDYALYIIRLELLRQNYSKPDYDAAYYAIKNNYSGEFREKLICLYFKYYGYHLLKLNTICEDAGSLVQLPKYKAFLISYKARTIGVPAYDFSLMDAYNKLISLHDFKNKIIFVDFWFTGCSMCTKFFKEQLSEVEKRYRNNNKVVFVSICIDKNKQSWLSSVQSCNYTSPDIYNLWTGTLGTKSPVISHYNVLSYPQPMLIDEKGKIRMFGDAEKLTSKELISQIDKIIIEK